METKNIYQKLFEVKKAWIKLQRDTKAFNYKYATLSQIQEKLWEVLQENSLLVTHSVYENKVLTRITNIEWNIWDFVNSQIELTGWTKPQDKWSEITYYRRYNLLSLLDLEVEDDDGKKAQDSKSEKKDFKDDPDKPWIEQTNIDNLKKLIGEWQHFSIKDVRDKYKVSKVNAELLATLGIN